MKKLALLILFLLVASTAHAQLSAEPVDTGTITPTPEWTNHNESDPSVTEGSTGSGSLIGEEVDPKEDGDPDRPVTTGSVPSTNAQKESGEKAGTEDINIGVGELQEAQHNQPDLDFTRERARISVSAREVRGWDPERKEAFLADVREHAEVRSSEDLENFALSVLLRDEQVENLSFNYTEIKMSYRFPAKFLGIFNATLPAETHVDEMGRVKVKYPWYRVFYGKFVKIGDIKGESQGAVDEARGTSVSAEPQELTPETIARTLEALSKVSKTLQGKN